MIQSYAYRHSFCRITLVPEKISEKVTVSGNKALGHSKPLFFNDYSDPQKKVVHGVESNLRQRDVKN